MKETPRRWPLLAAPAIGILLLGIFPWLQVRPNRIAEGTSRFLVSADPLSFGVVAALWLVWVPLLFHKRSRNHPGVLKFVCVLVPVVLTFAAGIAAARLSPSGSFARVSPSTGFWLSWLWSFGVYTLVGQRTVQSSVLLLLTALVLILGANFGFFSSLSLFKEYTAQTKTFWTAFGQHLFLAGTASVIGTVAGVLLGWAAWKGIRVRQAVFFVLNAVQTLPSLALFGLLIIPLAALGWGGIGTAPALVALSLYAAFPITRSTLTALQALDPAVLEAGRGLGFGPWNSFVQLQFPLALPAVLDGLRTASVQAVGNTVVAALIGAGGFGSLIFLGLGQYAPDLILLGTFPVVALALGLDFLWSVVLSFVGTPGGHRDNSI